MIYDNYLKLKNEMRERFTFTNKSLFSEDERHLYYIGIINFQSNK